MSLFILGRETERPKASRPKVNKLMVKCDYLEECTLSERILSFIHFKVHPFKDNTLLVTVHLLLLRNDLSEKKKIETLNKTHGHQPYIFRLVYIFVKNISHILFIRSTTLDKKSQCSLQLDK